MNERPKLKIVVRPWEVNERAFQWSATAIFDYPVQTRHGSEVRVVNVQGYSGWNAINKLLDNPSVIKYLYELEVEFLKEKSTMAKNHANAEGAAAAPDPQTEATPEAPAPEIAAPETKGDEAVETAAPEEPAARVAAAVVEAAQKEGLDVQVTEAKMPKEVASLSPLRRKIVGKFTAWRAIAAEARPHILQLLGEEGKTMDKGELNYWLGMVKNTQSIEDLAADGIKVSLGQEV